MSKTTSIQAGYENITHSCISFQNISNYLICSSLIVPVPGVGVGKTPPQGGYGVGKEETEGNDGFVGGYGGYPPNAAADVGGQEVGGYGVGGYGGSVGSDTNATIKK